MDTRYISPENLVASFQTLDPSMVVTQGCYKTQVPCILQDIDWNHMDQLHRPTVHKTYEESLRLVVTPSFQLSLTRVGWFKFLTLVTDIRLGPGLFYQAFSVFNLFYVHCIIRMIPLKEQERVGDGMTLHTIDWYIVSHRSFQFLHGVLSRRLYRLNDNQLGQDRPIQSRRTELRRKGYRLGSDQPDFLNSNTLTDNVIPPQVVGTHRISLKRLDETGLNQVSAGPIDLLIRRNGVQKGITVWPAVCPHEGGPMALGKVCNGTIICPWHDLKHEGATLRPDRLQEFLTNLSLSLEGDELVVRQRSDL